MAGLLVEGDGVTVEYRATESTVWHRVAGSADGRVPARHDPLELRAAGVAKDGDVVRSEAAAVILHLLAELRIELLGCHAFVDLLDHRLLVGREKLLDRLLHDRPVRLHVRALGMRPGHHDLLPLPGSEAV